MQILNRLFSQSQKDADNNFLTQQEINTNKNYQLNPTVKQSYLKSNINNILILGKAGTGKTHLAQEYYNNCSLQDKIFITQGSALDNFHYLILGQTLLKFAENFDSLFKNHKLIVIDDFESLLYYLSKAQKLELINCLKFSLNNPNQTVIVSNPDPIPLAKLNKIAQIVEYPLEDFDLILVGKFNYGTITKSYLSDFDSISVSEKLYYRSDEYPFLVYRKERDNSFKLREISQAKSIFGI